MAYGDIILLDDDAIAANVAANCWPCGVSTSIVAVAYSAYSAGVYAKTVVKTAAVDVGGLLTDTGYSLDVMDHDNEFTSPAMVKLSLDSNYFVLVHEGVGGAILITTLTITSDGAITLAHQLSVLSASGSSPRVVKLSGSMVAIAYFNGTNGTVKTYTINPSNGAIAYTGSSITITDYVGPGELLWISDLPTGEKLVILYRTSTNTGIMRVYAVNAFGILADLSVSVQVDSGDTGNNFMGGSIVAAGNKWLVIYSKDGAVSSDRCVGGTVIKSAEGSTRLAIYAFDNDFTTTNYWSAAATTGWIGYHFAGSEKWAVVSYTLTSGPTAERDPKNWTLQGSHDGVAWNTLDTRTGETFSSRGLTKTYTLVNAVEYEYYRVNITLNNGDANYVNVAEVELMSVSSPVGHSKTYTIAADSGAISAVINSFDWSITLKPGVPQVDHCCAFGEYNAAIGLYVVGVPWINDAGGGRLKALFVDSSGVISEADDVEFNAAVTETPRLTVLAGVVTGAAEVSDPDHVVIEYVMVIMTPTSAYTFVKTDGDALTSTPALTVPAPPSIAQDAVATAGDQLTATPTISVVSPPTVTDFACLVREKYQTGDDGDGVIYGNNHDSQTFTPSADHNLNHVMIRVKRVGTVEGNTMTVAIRATDGAGKPTGADLISKAFDFNGLPSAVTNIQVFFSSSTAVVSGTKYAIVVYLSGGDAGTYLVWRRDGSSPSYAGGSRVYSTDAGSTWTVDTANDYIFDEGETI